MSFIQDTLLNEGKFSDLTINEDFNREAYRIEAHFNKGCNLLVKILVRLKQETGHPSSKSVDNGLNFCARVLTDYCMEKEIKLMYKGVDPLLQ